MLTLAGNGHLSPAQEEKVLKAINSRLSVQVDAISTQTVHFVNVKDGGALADGEREILDQCLDYGFKCSATDMPYYIMVVPRSGTVTPWSSKATDILHLVLRPCPIDRIEHGVKWMFSRSLSDEELASIKDILHDRMTQCILVNASPDSEHLFHVGKPEPLGTIKLDEKALQEANSSIGLALQPDEIKYILDTWGRDPTDVEIMMFAQVNSEHCRHKIFNAEWTIDGVKQARSLFQMIKNTHQCHKEGVLSAYKDNAAVLQGPKASRYFSHPDSREYTLVPEEVHIVCKVETHNHPTAVSPFPGAATGSGGEIRDEGATGVGGKPKAGLTGFSVSHLLIPGHHQPWENTEIGKPSRIASALQIMLEAPIGGARFNNEFGRPAICGYFRSFLQEVEGKVRGYHKPIMLAGGVGNIRPGHVEKKPVGDRCHVVVLGGPAMLIGLGGGAASSMAQGASAEDLDYASVQRDNAELERRCQEVIDACVALGDANPILCIHDVGAGGLSNAIPEVLHDSGLGGDLELRQVPNAEPGMSPMAIWCNEAQERYVIAVSEEGFATLSGICVRERCPFASVGRGSTRQHLTLHDSHFDNNPIDLPISTLFGKPPRMAKTVTSEPAKPARPTPHDLATATADAALERVLQNPTVASKSFLITIGDRSVGGMVARDQMVGRWQTPVSDVSVTTSSYDSFTGEAMAIGERTPVAIIDGPASAGLAVGEALTNLLAADVRALTDVRFSANWMVNSGENEEDSKLYKTVEKVGMDLCPKLGICIPVGKDSMSMKCIWQKDGKERKVTAPLSLVVSAFSPTGDVRRTLTPDLKHIKEASVVAFVDLSAKGNCIGGSILEQCYQAMGSEAPELRSCDAIIAFSKAMVALRDEGLALAYHDRSDGGLAVTLVEMCLAGRLGIDVDVAPLVSSNALHALFCEELGVALQLRESDVAKAKELFEKAGYDMSHFHVLGKVQCEQKVVIRNGSEVLVDRKRVDLHRLWAETSYKMVALRDNPKTAQQEFDLLLDESNPGLNPTLTFTIPKPVPVTDSAFKVAILREQGVNGHLEMAWAFRMAGFKSVDVHMTDLLDGRVTLEGFRGVVACGGFSYGDTFGAGRGWANTIMGNPGVSSEFQKFFQRPDTFTLGICNGCQMLGSLSKLIPGASAFPNFTYNESGQFEARVSMVKIGESKSIFLQGMAGSAIPVAVSHGEGRAQFRCEDDKAKCSVALNYVDASGRPTEHFPENPNGSPFGIAGVCSDDGRVTAMMPHPERVLRTCCNSWSPDCEPAGEGTWGDFSPWLKMFVNAHEWCVASSR